MTTKPAEDDLHTTVFNAVPFLVFQKDTNNNILRANRAVAESLGVSLADLENTPSSHWFPDDVDVYYADDLKSFAPISKNLES